MSEEKKHECTCCFMCGTPGAMPYRAPGREKPVKLHPKCIDRYHEWLKGCLDAADAYARANQIH